MQSLDRGGLREATCQAGKGNTRARRDWVSASDVRFRRPSYDPSELRNSLDTIRTETERQAGYHLQLAQQIRTDLEGSSADFYARQVQHKKTYQAMIEKQFRQKQEQEARVMKAREKYEADCLLINSYTAQSTLVQGRDLDKITSRLERAQRTVQANERDFANFAKTLQTTAAKWEQDWKDFCDSCQDLEEDRLDFMRDNMWAYANAVSTVCVTDDEVRHTRIIEYPTH